MTEQGEPGAFFCTGFSLFCESVKKLSQRKEGTGISREKVRRMPDKDPIYHTEI